MKKLATEIKAGDKVRIPWIGICEVHHTHMTALDSVVGPMVVLNFGVGQAPVEIPADSHIEVVA